MTTLNYTPQCKVVYYRWDDQSVNSSGTVLKNLSATTPLEISSHVLNFSYSKDKDNPAGNFTLTLGSAPDVRTQKVYSNDWKEIIKPGSWLVVKLSQEGDLVLNPKVGEPIKDRNVLLDEAKKVRCIGYVDRVSTKIATNDNGSRDIVYTITGRDFGVVYEDTTIWHNLFAVEKAKLEAARTSALDVLGTVKLNDALKVIHNLIYNPVAVDGAKNSQNNPTSYGDSLTEIALQWLLPHRLLTDLGLSFGLPFWGSLDSNTNFESTDCGIAIANPADFLSGNAWQTLKRTSVPELHELYTELTDSGIPRLNFRPIPFAINKENYPNVGKNIKYFKDLDFILVKEVEVDSLDLGEDNPNRYNSFLTTVQTSLIDTSDNISWLQDTPFPLHYQDSVKRHGFRPMHVTVDSLVRNAEKNNGNPDYLLGREYNHVILDYWQYAYLTASGTVNISGRNDVRVGKNCIFDDLSYEEGRIYYIEGYTDTFNVIENGAAVWDQEIRLSNGYLDTFLNLQDLLPSTRLKSFAEAGEYTSRT